ncbi:MAG: antibiotic biosynthesis monooxygenase, partial [Prevotella sp.]|nr:antibiotic biosynthesis monooxygenase [Prevotella sp.]
MIRLNAFFKVKAGVTTAQVKALTDELVELSRKDEGNKGYDLFESTTQPGVFLF